MMQTAVDYNGSNSNSVINIAAATTTTTISSNNNTNTNAHNNTNNVAATAADAVTLTTAATSTGGLGVELGGGGGGLGVELGGGGGLGVGGAKDATPIGRSPLLPEHQPQSVLRNRLQSGKSTNHHHNHDSSQQHQSQQQQQQPLNQQQHHKFNASSGGAMLGNNGHDHDHAHRPFETAEYLGSNVEQMSVTPSPSPQTSPAKRAADGRRPIANIEPMGQGCENLKAKTSLMPPSSPSPLSLSPMPLSSSSSSSSSAANSSTSSVIATPILERNGNASSLRLPDGAASNDHLETSVCGGGGGDNNKTSVEPPFITSSTSLVAPLPIKSASFSTFGEHLTTASSALVTGNTTTPSSSSSSSPKSQQQPPTEEELLQWKDMPQYLQFNPYVLKGYRPLQTFKGCLFSLFYWHNETINILTHALPIVYILAIVPGLMPWDRGYRFLSFCHVFGSVAPWCGSFVYHLFMNIERGENVYYRLLKLDMVGIWVSQSFGALPLVTATAFCFTHKWKWFIIISYCLFSLWGLYKALTASSPWQRRLCFALPFTMRSILSFLRTMKVGGGNPVALSHVYLQDGVSILGGAIGAMRIPEKWFPGLVDYYLNSHNIMHVLVVVAVYSMHKATIKDFEWMSSTTCEAFANATNETLETTFSANMEL